MTKIMMMKDIGDDDGILQIGGRGTAFQGSFCTRGFTEGATISSIRGIEIMTMVMPAMMLMPAMMMMLARMITRGFIERATTSS